MKTVITNEGKKIQVSPAIYASLKSDFESGAWMSLIKIGESCFMVSLCESFIN